MGDRNDSILIVGAGPTGLTAALELTRRGYRPRIIDRDEGPTPLSKAVGISAHSLDILEPSGVAERLLAAGLRVRHVHLFADGSPVGVVDLSRIPHRHNFLLSLPQADTEKTIGGVLTGLGVGIEWRTRLADLTPTATGVAVVLEGPNGRREDVFDIVFGADGVHSATRDALGLTFDGYTHKRQWSIADVEVADWPYEPGAADLFLHENGDIGFVIPIGKERFRAVSNTPDAMARVPGRYTLSRTLRADLFEIHIRQAPRYQSGGVFLGGDAAHVHSPVAARGMNLGIEDAACFARRFADGTLDRYTDERHPVGKRWIEIRERVLSLAELQSPLKRAARDLMMLVVGHAPLLQRPGLLRVAGLRE